MWSFSLDCAMAVILSSSTCSRIISVSIQRTSILVDAMYIYIERENGVNWLPFYDMHKSHSQ